MSFHTAEADYVPELGEMCTNQMPRVRDSHVVLGGSGQRSAHTRPCPNPACGTKPDRTSRERKEL